MRIPRSMVGVDTQRNAIRLIEPQEHENLVIYDGTAAWSNAADTNTVVDKDIPLPTTLQPDAVYLIVINNVSTVTALTVVVKSKETFGEAVKYPELTRFTVPADSVKSYLVQGWLIGEAGRLTLSNDTVLGAAEGFTSSIRIRKV
jgi:hypothetical protein